MHYCAYQDRSHQEAEQKMREFMLIPEARDELLMFLMAENYLNEERFTRSYIRGKFKIKQWGRNKIRLNLRQKGVTDRMADRCFDEIDPAEYAKVLREQYLRYYSSLSGLQAYQKRSKTIRYLLGRGFEYPDIEAAEASLSDE